MCCLREKASFTGFRRVQYENEALILDLLSFCVLPQDEKEAKDVSLVFPPLRKKERKKAKLFSKVSHRKQQTRSILAPGAPNRALKFNDRIPVTNINVCLVFGKGKKAVSFNLSGRILFHGRKRAKNEGKKPVSFFLVSS